MKKCVCCFMALCLLVLSGCGKSEPLVVYSDVCPFTITVQDDQMFIQIDTSQVEGCTWTYQAKRDNICEVSMSENAEEQETFIGIKSIREGSEELRFYCAKDGDVPEYRFICYVKVLVDEKNNILVQDYACRDYAGNGVGPADAPCPYEWQTLDSGVLALTVLCEESDEWVLVESESDAFAVGSLYYGSTGRLVEINPLAAGTGEILLKNAALGQEFSFTVTVGEYLLVTVAPTVEAAEE